MKIERTVTVAVNEAIALERATAYLRQVGYKQVSSEPFLVFQRGFVLGSLTSFTPKHWRSKAKIHIMPDNNRVKVVVVFEVNRIGQFVIGKDKAFWDAEIEGLKAAICSGDIDTTKETKVAREALVQYIAVTIAIVSIILIAFVAAIWISTSASGPAEGVIAAWHLSQGNRFYRQDNYDKAIEAYNKAIEYNPNLARAYNHISLAYGYKGQHDMAISSCNKAIELDPSLSSAYNNRAVAYALKGEYDLAITDFTKVIELYPDYAEAYENRGTAYYRMGEYVKAEPLLKQALTIAEPLSLSPTKLNFTAIDPLTTSTKGSTTWPSLIATRPSNLTPTMPFLIGIGASPIKSKGEKPRL